MHNSKNWENWHLYVGSPTNFVTDTSLAEISKWHQLPTITNQKVLEIGIGYVFILNHIFVYKVVLKL
jgi:hypothetical protein